MSEDETAPRRGRQARTQLQAAALVREFDAIKVFSRNHQRCQTFSQRMSDQLNQNVEAVDSARAATEEADVLICATISHTPVIQAGWLKQGVHVNNIGPKFTDSQELGIEVAQRASHLVTDSMAQAEALGDRLIVAGTEHRQRLVELSSIVADLEALERGDEEITLFYSLGLAGTEVLLAGLLSDLVGA